MWRAPAGSSSTASRRSRAASGRVAQARDRGRARARQGAAVVEDGHALGGVAARGVDEPARGCRATPCARSARRPGARPRSVRGPGGRSRSSPRASACAGPRRRRASSSAWAWSESRSHVPLASKITTASDRVAGGATRVAAASQVVAQRHAKPNSALVPSPASSSASTPGRRTSSTVRSTERTARLSSRTRSASLSSKRLIALRRRAGLAGPLPRSCAIAIGRGDVVGLLEGRAQRLDLGELELPVPARRAPRLGEPEAALPGAQRVRADAEHGRSGVRADGTHAAMYRGLVRFAQRRQAPVQRGGFVAASRSRAREPDEAAPSGRRPGRSARPSAGRRARCAPRSGCRTRAPGAGRRGGPRPRRGRRG